jgi:polyribonucleotide nucleotidyltransferase
LHISDIPFARAIGAVRVCVDRRTIRGQPDVRTARNRNQSDFVVAGHPDGLIMIEGESEVMPEDQVVEGLRLAQEAVIAIAKAQDDFRQAVSV